MNRQIRLNSRPVGEPTADNFAAVDGPMPAVNNGDVLRRTIYLSLDPYMRGRMSDAASYATPVNIGDVMFGHTVSEVIESRNPDFSKGDFVVGYDGWQAYGVSAGKELRKLDPKSSPDLDRDRRPRNAGDDGIRGLDRHRSTEAGRNGCRVRRVRCSRRRRRATREDHEAAAPSVSPALPTSAGMWWRNSASTPASTTNRTTSCPR